MFAKLRAPTHLTALSLQGRTISLDQAIVEADFEEAQILSDHGFTPLSSQSLDRLERRATIEQLVTHLRTVLEGWGDEDLTGALRAIREGRADMVPPLPAPVAVVKKSTQKRKA